jgi:hypothetical protein
MRLLLERRQSDAASAIGASPEAKKKIAESLRQLLAVASQARKEGLANDPKTSSANSKASARSIVTASLYDKKINEGKGGNAAVQLYHRRTGQRILEAPGREMRLHKIGLGTNGAEFKQFLDSKIALAKESGTISRR